MTFVASRTTGGEVSVGGKIVGKDDIYKFFWVGVLLAEKWIDKIIDVKRVNSRIMVIKILVDQTALALVSTYAPQQGLEDSVKNNFQI